MGYYFARDLNCNFEEAKERVVKALSTEGFGVLTEIDVQSTLKKKIQVDFPRYTILGACNPHFAHKALISESMIGTMLPCNVVVTESEPGRIRVAAVDPVASMSAIENASLGPIAVEVRNKLQRVIEML